MEDTRPGGEFGQKCPHCGHYNRFSARLKWLRARRAGTAKRICSKCEKDFDKEYPESKIRQTSLIRGFYYVSPDFCKMMGIECKDCQNKGCLSRQSPLKEK